VIHRIAGSGRPPRTDPGTGKTAADIRIIPHYAVSGRDHGLEMVTRNNSVPYADKPLSATPRDF